MKTAATGIPSARPAHSPQGTKCIVLLAVALSLLSSPARATPQLFPGNGHYYEVIPVLEGISWADAQAAAASQVWQGQQGHLATIRSPGENQFAFDLSLGLGIWHVSTVWTVGPWIGGFQQDGAAEPAGGWGWITGEVWDYTHWMPGQPDNNSPPVNENRLLFWGEGAITPTWNDYVEAPPLYPLEDRVWGYVVEFDTPPVGVEETSWGQIKALYP